MIAARNTTSPDQYHLFNKQEYSGLNFTLDQSQLHTNNLTLLHIKVGEVLEAKQCLFNGKVKMVLCKHGLPVATLPIMLSQQLLRLRGRGIRFEFEVKLVEKMNFAPPSQLKMLVKQSELRNHKAV